MRRPDRMRRARATAIRGAILLAAAVVLACDPSSPEASDDILVNVRYVALDPHAGSPVLLLEEQQGERKLPIWIGFSEARSIASEMESRSEPRPNTHDLAKNVIDGLDAEVVRVIVTELRDRTFFALLILRSHNGTIEIDSRPSDAIAIALRFEAPVYVRASVFEDSDALPDSEHPEHHVMAPERLQQIGS